MLAPKGDLPLVKSHIVVVRRSLDGMMLRAIALDHDATAPFAATGTAGHLGQQLKGALAAAKIGQKEPHICCNYTDQGHHGQIQPLGDHLRPDQHIRFVGGKGAQDLFMAAPPPGRVGIPADDPRLGAISPTASAMRSVPAPKNLMRLP